jgi:aldehyde:ferredoxin oxidoreductase
MIRAPRCGRRDPEKFKAANKAFRQGLKEHAVTGEGLPAYGTNVLTNVVNEAGGLSHQRNFQEGQFKGAAAISGEAMAELETSPGREGHPRLPPGMRDPVFRHLHGQGRPLPDQTAGI